MKIKSILFAITFVTLMLISGSEVLASGAYGTGAYGSVTNTSNDEQEIHETVDAGIEDVLPQLGVTMSAVLGLFTTGYLLNKTK